MAAIWDGVFDCSKAEKTVEMLIRPHIFRCRLPTTVGSIRPMLLPDDGPLGRRRAAPQPETAR